MADLTYLNDAAVLHNLRQRYYAKLIYVSGRAKRLNYFINTYRNIFPADQRLQEGPSSTSEPA